MAAPKSLIQTIDIKKIKVSKTRRKSDEAKIKELADSIKSLGLIHPIVVDDENNLVAGLHRLSACESLGWDKIKATVYTKNSDLMKLLEIDENLMRNELNYVERGEVLVDRQEVYDKLFPTKSDEPKLRSLKGVKDSKNGKDDSEGATVAPSFTEDTASKTGLSQRTVQVDIQIAKNLNEDVKEQVIDLINEDKIQKNDVMKIARKDEKDQKKILNLIEKKDYDVKDAIKEVERGKREKEIEKTDPKRMEDLKIMEKLGIKLELYNIWNIAKRDLGFGKEHFGNQPADMIFNLLYYYTNPKDLVWDVCAGGGVVHDVCDKFNRKCYSTDLFPVRKEIKELDVVKDALPDIEPQFIFVDVPYWKQAEKQYSESEKDFGNMSLEDFYSSMEKLFNKICKKYKDFTMAIIIGNSQWVNEDKHVEPHALKFYEMLNKKMDFVHELIIPYNTQIYNGTQIEIAKEQKIILNLHRDLLIFRSK